MRYIVCLILVLSTSLITVAQFVETFSDSNITHNPLWLGELSKFQVNNNKKLQLNGIATKDTATIYTSSKVSTKAFWMLSLDLLFNPSSSNFVDVFIMADINNNDVSGYFVRIGSRDDNISLYKKNGSTIQSLIQGPSGVLNRTSNQIDIRVERDSAHVFRLMYKERTQNTFSNIGSVLDSSILESNYFILQPVYTSSRRTGIIFDSIVVQGDSLVPRLEIDTIMFITSNSIRLRFNQPVMPTLSDTSSITMMPVNKVDSLYLVSDSVVDVFCTQPFLQGETYVITWRDLSSLGVRYTVSDNFEFYISPMLEKHQIRISEIMYDPSPSVGLPESEYIEIYNASSDVINIQEMTLYVGSSREQLPKHYLSAGSYATLVSAKDTGLFKEFKEIIGIDKWPTLTNTGSTIRIEYNQKILDSISYTEKFHTEYTKRNGGWSLELINPYQHCLEADNWKSSESIFGGTVSAVNSIWDTSYTGLMFIPLSLQIKSGSVDIAFNLPLDTFSTTMFTLAPNLLIDSIKVSGNNLFMKFENKLDTGRLYSLEINGLKSCSGRSLDSNKIQWLINKPLETSDIIINELLTESKLLGEEFIELYNTTSRTINLNTIWIDKYNGFNVQDSSLASEKPYYLLPNDYVAISRNTSAIKSTYSTVGKLHQQVNLPDFNTTEQIIRLRSVQSSRLLDQFHYRQTLHYTLLNETEGVSIERISTQSPTSSDDNWHSAASYVDYATPGYENSQTQSVSSEGRMSLSSKTLSPDNDGYQDVITIKIDLEAAGYVGQINIYNAFGLLVKALATDKLFSEQEELRWSGVDINQAILPAGKYIIFLELIHPNGRKVVEKKVIALIK